MLYEPNTLTVNLLPSTYDGGFNISSIGGNDGNIGTEVGGGNSPYTYAWSNSATTALISGLTAGTYSVTVTDENGCTTTGSKTMTQPSGLQITSITAANHNGHNISCYRGNDGSITLSVSGGVTPYTYEWSNGSFEQNPTDLYAGEHNIRVTDANGATVESSITLTQPNPLKVVLTTSDFSGYNISCFGCADGAITTSVTGGTSSYSYLWEGGSTSANRTGLTVGDGYYVTVTDANGCTASNQTSMTEPGGGGWSLHGNPAGATDDFGTTNTTPLKLKTDNTERMRIDATGNVGIGTNAPTEKMDVNGNLKVSGSLKLGGAELTFGQAGGGHPMALTIGNPGMPPIDPILFTCLSTYSGPIVLSGTGLYQSIGSTAGGQIARQMVMGHNGTNAIIEAGGDNLFINELCGGDVNICNGSGGGNIFMTTPTTGTVTIGDTYVPSGYKLAVNGKIIAEELLVKLRGNWPDYVFDKKYLLMTVKELSEYIKLNKHLPEMPTAKEVEKNGVSTGEMLAKLLKKQEELTLYIIEQNKRIEELEKKVGSN